MTTPSYIPSVRARRLARQLRDLREQTGMSQSAVAKAFGWSQGKVGHIETARNKVSVHDTELLLDLYGVGSPDRDQIIALAREADRRNWWADYSEVFAGPYVALEDAASEIFEWAPQVIPGLLQTPAYARALLSGANLGTDIDIDQKLRARMARQTILTRAKEPPHLHAIIAQDALESGIGGQEVMRDQLRALTSAARSSNIRIQVLRRGAGAHPGLSGAGIVLRFAEPLDPDVAYIEGLAGGGIYLENQRQVGLCSLALQELAELALPDEESIDLLEAIAANN